MGRAKRGGMSERMAKRDPVPDRAAPRSASPNELADSVFEKPLPRAERDYGALAFFRRVAPTVTFAIVLYTLLTHFSVVGGALGTLMGALTPVLIGVVLAFILNVPMRMFETQALGWLHNAPLRRGLSILLCYLLLGGFGLLLVFVVIPQFTAALDRLGRMLPELGANLYSSVQGLSVRLGLDEELLVSMKPDWNGMARDILTWTTSSLPVLLSTTRDITGRVMEAFLGFVLSAYMLAGKERLAHQSRRLCRAVLRPHWADRVISLCTLAQATFRGYLTGMLTEACILGALTATGMALLGFPSPVFGGMLMAIGALVPIFGIFAMVVVNAVIILVQTDMTTALWFVVYITVLQQLEGNLIYPRVMGSAIRLPGIWVLAAATVGGTLLGLGGLLLSIPVVSIAYSLVRAFVEMREERAVQEADDRG